MCSTDGEQPDQLIGHAIVAGFGVPGRAVADFLASREIPFCVVELNRQTVERCAHRGVHIIEGDVCDEQTLRRAGAERSSLLVLAVPSDPAVLEAIRVARRLNPKLRIVARCRFISSGLEAHRRGASEVVVEEQVVGSEMTRLLAADFPELTPADPKPPKTAIT
ncbi:MAG TPA: NAD(P)-binding protein [Tepidisphaeraceae bacterium]|jgi:voltage-gated potassium channel Kch|nr:NAD(P)-binding protein [Tepidisphaeraceae bacterium]